MKLRPKLWTLKSFENFTARRLLAGQSWMLSVINWTVVVGQLS